VITIGSERALIMPILARTKVGKYFRTTVPREVRRILEIEENDVVEWVLEGDRIMFRKGKNGSGDKRYGGKE